jgi:hypothetical protein
MRQTKFATRQHRRSAFHDVRLTTDVCVQMQAQAAQLAGLSR